MDHSYNFEKIVLTEGPLEEYGIEYHIVRSVHDNKLVVSEQFKELMEANQVNSFSFLPEYSMEW